METFLPISYLNDFIFCPYSIYLHQVFDTGSEDVYSAKPQQTGKTLHADIDDFAHSVSDVLKGIYVISNQLGVYGKIDKYYTQDKKLVESKYAIKVLYKGYYYQLWAQYFAMIEMGYEVNVIEFFCIKDKITHRIPLPGKTEFNELRQHIRTIAWYDFDKELKINPEKCTHCIYSSLCDKTTSEHVYS